MKEYYFRPVYAGLLIIGAVLMLAAVTGFYFKGDSAWLFLFPFGIGISLISVKIEAHDQVDHFQRHMVEFIQDTNLKMQGHRDHISGMHTKLDQVQHSLAVIESRDDEVSKVIDKVALMDLNGSLSNRLTGVHPTVTEYRPKPKKA